MFLGIIIITMDGRNSEREAAFNTYNCV